MRRRAAWLCPFILAIATTAGVTDARAECSTFGLPDGRKVAELQTSAGELCIELLDDVDEAPGHVENFLYYLESGAYDDVIFSRFVPGFVIQGGQWRVGPTATTLVEKREDFVVTNEPCTRDIQLEPPRGSICSERGNDTYTVALAKLGGDPDSGSSEWFINLGDNRENLDQQNGGFTVFGRLIHAQSFATAERMGGSVRALTEDLFWSGSRFAYGTIDVDGETFILPELEDLPLLEIPPYDSEAYGCLDMTQQATLVLDDDLPDTPLDPNDPDAPYPGRHVVSAACGQPFLEPLAAWPNAKGPGTVDCPEPDRLALRSLSITPLQDIDDELVPGILSPPGYVSLTCEQLRESDAQRALWQQDFRDLLVVIESSTVRVAVPEPGAAASAAAALGCLAWLKRRSAPKHA